MRSSNGSMWMSLALSCTASVMIRFTSLTTGASELSSWAAAACCSTAVSVKSMAVSVNSWSIESALSPSERP